MGSVETMIHDIEQARHFLTLLDETCEQFTFQTFDDNRERIKERAKRKEADPLARCLHGTIEQHWGILCVLNNQGAGIFVMAQAGNGNKRDNASVERIRCVFNENDNGLPKQYPIEPHIVVSSSPGKEHHYFLCDELAIDEFGPILNRMVEEYGSDPAAQGIARVLRLPGFYHRKADPYLVKVIHESAAQPYSKAQLITAFPPCVKASKSHQSEPVNVDQKLIVELRSALLFMYADDRAHWIKIGLALKELGDVGRGLWLEWSSTSDKFDAGIAAKTWESFKPDGISYKSVFVEAQKAGWVNIAKKQKPQPKVEDVVTDFEQVKKEPKKPLQLNEFIDKSHLLNRIVAQTSAETTLPISTVLLMGLSIYSAMALRKYCVKYENGARLPIGLYAVAEQPPGSAKSWCLNTFQQPFYASHANVPEIEEGTKPCLFITNATGEALEVTLDASRGIFSVASSEQGLFNALFGASYTSSDRANNNDVALSGFDGSYVNSKRVGRKGYEGQVCGSITCFAQQGSIESVLKASGGTGLSERFLMLSEDHSLGTRDHLRVIYRDSTLLDEYGKSCDFIDEVIRQPLTFSELTPMLINKDGFKLINEYRNLIEPRLLDGGLYAAASLRGAAGKVNMQIMKIAANLHLMNNGGLYFKSFIDNEHVVSAISIADALLNANLHLCVDKGIFGFKAEYTAIINYITGRSGLRSELDIINSMKTTKPFKMIEKNKNMAIRKCLHEMVEKKLLASYADALGKTIYVLAK
jgi:Protein of unknown function (DUF3987)/Primase C terminal 2 (PriCT-2)/RepB DNA-primase from phage plasmid